MEHDPYFWTSNFEPQHLRVEGVDFHSAGAPSVGYAFSLLYDVSRLLRRARRETIGALHGLHLKRVIKHVSVSSPTTDQKVIVALPELQRLAHEQAEIVYRQHCSNVSPLSLDAITRTFADHGCLTVKDALKRDTSGLLFRVYPEIVGCGEKSPWTSVLAENQSQSGAQLLQRQNDVANSATFILDDWFGDDLVFAQRNYLCTETFLQALEIRDISGFTAHPANISRSGKFPQIEKVAKPLAGTKFFRLEIGNDKSADMFLIPHVALFLNERALDAIADLKTRYEVFIVGYRYSLLLIFFVCV
jgi:hypothetical protein